MTTINVSDTQAKLKEKLAEYTVSVCVRVSTVEVKAKSMV